MIIYIQEGQRRIPIQYASRVRGRRMYQGGADVPAAAGQPGGRHPDHLRDQHPAVPGPARAYFSISRSEGVTDIATAIVAFLAPTTILYSILYFLLTVGFTYFYTAFTFKPDETAEQLRKNGGFIPGIRPGGPTQEYLAKVVIRITLAGALFLGTVAVAPDPRRRPRPEPVGGLALGGTGLLIVVSVVVETMKQIEAQLMMRNYEGFIR